LTAPALLALLAGGNPAIAEPASSAKALAAITADYNAGRYLPALEKSLVVVRKEPNNLEIHYLLGNIFIRLDKLENAYEEYVFCVQNGKGTRIAEYARKAMKNMEDMAAQAPLPPDATPSQQSRPSQQSQQSQPQRDFPLPPSMQQQSQPSAQGSIPTSTQSTGQLGRGERQSAERRDATDRQGADFIEAKRRTLQAQITHLNEDMRDSINQVPRYVYFGKQRVPNPDYESTVQTIKDECASKIQAMQDDNTREESKINSFYKGLSNSYSQSSDNLRSRGDDGRAGPKLIDNDPNMYVQNYGPGRGGSKP